MALIHAEIIPIFMIDHFLQFFPKAHETCHLFEGRLMLPSVFKKPFQNVAIGKRRQFEDLIHPAFHWLCFKID